jgi:hypothetical protein
MVHERRRNPWDDEVQSVAEEEFTDWDNPEDDEDAPEGYYDDDDDTYIPDEDDPDYDLSEAHGYADWEAPKREGIFPQWVTAAFSIFLIIAILIPILLQVR